jgi:hypothetical protein
VYIFLQKKKQIAGTKNEHVKRKLLIFRLELLKGPISVGLDCLNVSLEARTGISIPFKTTKKAYHRGFGQLDCIP